VKTPDLPAPAIDLDSYDPSVVSSTARERVDEYLLRVSDNAPIKFSIIAGPSIPDTQIELERSRVIKSAQFWSSMYDFEPTIFVYGGDDAEWMVSQLNARGNYFHDNLIKGSFWEKTGVCAQSLAVTQRMGLTTSIVIVTGSRGQECHPSLRTNLHTFL